MDNAHKVFSITLTIIFVSTFFYNEFNSNDKSFIFKENKKDYRNLEIVTAFSNPNKNFYRGKWSGDITDYSKKSGIIEFTSNMAQISFELLDGSTANMVKKITFTGINANFDIANEKLFFSANFVNELLTIDYFSILNRSICEDIYFKLEFNITNSNATFGNLNSTKCGMNIFFEAEISQDDLRLYKISLFSFSYFIVNFFNFFYSVIETRKLERDPTQAHKYSLLNYGGSIIWDIFISILIFSMIFQFLADDRVFVLGLFLSFSSFSIFKLRTFLIIWKSHNISILSNPELLRKKIMRLYLSFYGALLVVIFQSKEILMNETLLTIFVSFSWIPQIVYSILIGKSGYPFISLIIMSFNRLYFPLYLKMCPSNIFRFENSLIFSYIIIVIISISFFIVLIQNLCGARVIIPQFLRKKEYNYFITEKQALENFNFENRECSICLCDIVSTNESDKLFFESEIKVNRNKWIKCCKINNKKFNEPLMITPCKHVFHSLCLNKWHENRQDCPICRLPLPPIFVE